jgi:hypothetical protein
VYANLTAPQALFRPARLPGELGLAASPLLYRERQDYLAAIRAAVSGVEGARVTLAKARQRLLDQ